MPTVWKPSPGAARWQSLRIRWNTISTSMKACISALPKAAYSPRYSKPRSPIQPYDKRISAACRDRTSPPHWHAPAARAGGNHDVTDPVRTPTGPTEPGRPAVLADDRAADHRQPGQRHHRHVCRRHGGGRRTRRDRVADVVAQVALAVVRMAHQPRSHEDRHYVHHARHRHAGARAAGSYPHAWSAG